MPVLLRDRTAVVACGTVTTRHASPGRVLASYASLAYKMCWQATKTSPWLVSCRWCKVMIASFKARPSRAPPRSALATITLLVFRCSLDAQANRQRQASTAREVTFTDLVAREAPAPTRLESPDPPALRMVGNAYCSTCCEAVWAGQGNLVAMC